VKNVSGYVYDYGDSRSSISVLNVNYDANYKSTGGSGTWVQGATNIGSCSYTNPGVYHVDIGVDGGGAARTQHGAADVTLFPSSKLSIQVTVPTLENAPYVTIQADAAGIMPATGQWGSVDMILRCDGNLQYEQAIASGVSPDVATRVYGGDGQINDTYNINFNTPDTPKVSTASHGFTCNYQIAGTHTPTVVVQQNSITAAGGSEINVPGELKCDGRSINETKLHSALTLDWAAQKIDHCNALGDGWGWNGKTNVTSPYIIPDLNATVGRTYTYTVRCYDSSDPSKYIESSCLVKVTP
jgi:hypothetical protein